MSDDAKPDDGAGKIIETTKQFAAIRQIQAAIYHFWHDDYECAITLAAAAEGVMPTTDEPHMFATLKASPAFKELDANLFINWMKHPTGPDAAYISEFEVAMVIMRAISKLIAIYKDGTDDMRKFVVWVFETGHLPLPEEWPAKPPA